MRRLLVLAFLFLASTSPARADNYRAEIAVADLVGGGSFAVGVELGLDSSLGLGLTVGGATIAALGGPILHGAHGNTGRMVGSIFLRAGLPTVGMFAGYFLSPENNVKFRHGRGLIGFMAGYAVATVIDIAMATISTEPEESARVFSIGGRF